MQLVEGGRLVEIETRGEMGTGNMVEGMGIVERVPEPFPPQDPASRAEWLNPSNS